MFEKESIEFAKWLESIGINPIYFMTIFWAVVAYFEYEAIEDWEKSTMREKIWVVLAVLCFFIGVVMSIVLLLSLVEYK
ncbi:hypothetical protein CRI94_01590 [Longibacter salinarum]|uniref:Uncharacterized protein n=1 Tax=Longibacter salinarum TaxID=1850348 RepID=A0A2A8D2G4_9BACT|nr:hypothetical protein [Longibacter salinarum]PEN15007.1 hypothetical protein CRI94_01590 [Longibacter salinarum]